MYNITSLSNKGNLWSCKIVLIQQCYWDQCHCLSQGLADEFCIYTPIPPWSKELNKLNLTLETHNCKDKLRGNCFRWYVVPNKCNDQIINLLFIVVGFLYDIHSPIFVQLFYFLEYFIVIWLLSTSDWLYSQGVNISIEEKLCQCFLCLE